MNRILNKISNTSWIIISIDIIAFILCWGSLVKFDLFFESKLWLYVIVFLFPIGFANWTFDYWDFRRFKQMKSFSEKRDFVEYRKALKEPGFLYG